MGSDTLPKVATLDQPEEFTPAQRERIVQAAIATEALSGFTLSREVALKALESALRKPLMNLLYVMGEQKK